MRDLSTASLEELSDLFVASVLGHRDGVEKLTPRVTNRHADLIFAVYRELRARGGKVREEVLLPLLRHDSPSVRLWAGSHALEFFPEAGEPVVAEIAQMDGSIGFEAESTLVVWRDGELRFS